MADITPAIPSEINVIHAYGNGGFRISGVAHSGSVVVLPTLVEAWPVAALAEITEASLRVVVEAEPRVELLLVGCGPRLMPLPAELRRFLRALGIAAEPMDTGAACRTYNVLVAEGRRVAAALIAIP
ncbi:MAG: Mth938-like domain-containing protein [Candidatus Eiseniibacteriota bacterium]